MKRYIDPKKIAQPAPEVQEELPASSFDVEKLLAQGGEILNREVKNLLMESSRGKLNAASARDLCNYIKLLSELKKEQQEALKELSDEEIEKLKETI